MSHGLLALSSCSIQNSLLKSQRPRRKLNNQSRTVCAMSVRSILTVEARRIDSTSKAPNRKWSFDEPEVPRKRSRSLSSDSDSVSTISTNLSRSRSRSPPPRQKERSYDNAAGGSKHEPHRYRHRDSSSDRDRQRRRSRSLSSNRSRHGRLNNRKRAYSRSRSPHVNRAERASHRYRSRSPFKDSGPRNDPTQRQGSGSNSGFVPSYKAQPRQRSLSPYSKRLALTQGTNTKT